MTVHFVGNFSKRRNSTKQPSGGTSRTVVLKEGTSMMKPAFLLSSALYTWNYAIWDGRYYYITDIVAESNTLFRVECELDLMATYKNAIGNYSTMIARAASDQNFDVVDSVYPAKTRPVTKRTAITNPGIFTTNRSSGCYIIGTIGGAGQHFYVFTPSAFALFCIKLFPALSVSTIDTWIETQISQATVGGLGTILQNIVLMKWLPVSYSSVSGLLTAVSSVRIGNFIVEASAGELAGNTTVQLLGTTIAFADRDDAGARGRWLYLSPFANYSVYIPPFGMINIDPAFVPGAGRELVADIMCEVVSGNVTLRLYYSIGYSGPKMIGVYNANVSQDLRAGGSSANVGGVVGGTMWNVHYALDVFVNRWANKVAESGDCKKMWMPNIIGGQTIGFLCRFVHAVIVLMAIKAAGQANGIAIPGWFTTGIGNFGSMMAALGMPSHF